MPDRVIERWDDIGWITKRRIDWIIIKAKYKIDRKTVASIITILAIVGVLILENHAGRQMILLSAIGLLNFYNLLADRLITSH